MWLCGDRCSSRSGPGGFDARSKGWFAQGTPAPFFASGPGGHIDFVTNHHIAKLKPARGKRKDTSPKSAVPCLILIVATMGLLIFLFYLVLQSGR